MEIAMDIKEIELKTLKLIEQENELKFDIIYEIRKIIKPFLKNSGYVKLESNGLRAKNKEEKYIKIAKLPYDIFIPSTLVLNDTCLNHFADNNDTISTNIISTDGLHLDFGSFSDFYIHSCVTLEVILMQIQSMNIQED
jgi:hypothetical protein